MNDYDEIMALPTDDMRISAGGRAVTWGGGRMACLLDGEDYAHYKRKLIKMRYSNDDQIAVMLNGDAAQMEQMQRWRQWAAEVARRVMQVTVNSE